MLNTNERVTRLCSSACSCLPVSVTHPVIALLCPQRLASPESKQNFSHLLSLRPRHHFETELSVHCIGKGSIAYSTCLLLLSSRPHDGGKGVSTGGHLGCHFTVALHYSHVSFPLSPSYVVLPDEWQVILLISVNAKKFFEFGSFLRPPIWLITSTAQKCRFSIKFFHMK